MVKYRQLLCQSLTIIITVDRNNYLNDRTYHGTEPYNIYSSVPYFVYISRH